jgi:flagellar motor protein MotB
MDDAMKKKLTAVAAALIGAFAFGESQLLDIDKRISALEEIHPELAEEVEDEEESEEAPAEEELSDDEQALSEEAAAETQPLIETEGE